MREVNSTELWLIENTGSPSGRYAVAWGIPGIARLERFDSKTFPEQDVRNYLVEKRTMASLGTIPLHGRSCEDKVGGGAYKDGGNHWAGWHGRGGLGMRSHSGISTYWDSSEQWAAVVHSGKWWYDAIYLCHRQANQFKFVEIGDKIEDLVRAHLLKTRRAVYRKFHSYDCRNPFVDIASVKVTPSRITLEVNAGIPKEEEDPLGFIGMLELRIHDRPGRFYTSPVLLKAARTN